MTFLNKLDYLLDKNKMNKNMLSKACDIPYTTIDGWYKKGYDGVKLSTLRKLSKYFNVPLDYWADTESELPVLTFPEQAHKYTEMPVYNEPAAAGTGNYLQESSYETMSFPADSIPVGAEFGVRISGNSMEPIIKDGNIVWVKPQVSIENGEIGIFVLNNDAFCKRLHIDYDNKIVELISDNPDYQPIIVTKNDNLFTIGKVLGINSKTASVTDFKPANKDKVLHGRAVAFGGATLETEIDEDAAMEIAELRKKLDEKQSNN